MTGIKYPPEFAPNFPPRKGVYGAIVLLNGDQVSNRWIAANEAEGWVEFINEDWETVTYYGKVEIYYRGKK